MLNFAQLVTTVQQNCDISDARYAGDYAICIFLLKMREFYRWECGIPLTGPLPKDKVGEWLMARERLWETMDSMPYEPLALPGGSADPFDSDAINHELVPHGYVYSGGYGRFGKPHFFLGALTEKSVRSGHTVYISSCEYARDLVAPPAMMQGENIYLRQESVRRFVWERVEEWRWNRKNQAMAHALSCYDLERDTEAGLDRMMAGESESMILHEIGEGMAGKLLGDAWHEMLATLSRSKAEIMARAVRDLLADCLSTLPGLVEKEDAAALHFYFAGYSGMRKYLFPEAMDAYHQWAGKNDYRPLHRLIESGARRWSESAQAMLQLYQQDNTRADRAIEQWLDPEAAA